MLYAADTRSFTSWATRFCVAFLLLAGLLLAGASVAHAVEPGSISGTVIDEAAAPLEGITVAVWEWGDFGSGYEWGAIASEYTDGAGGYSLGMLEPATYKVSFGDWCSVYEMQFWNDKPDVYEADDVVVLAGQTSSGINATLRSRPVIAAGTVTDAVTGEPIADAEVYAYRYFEDEEWGGWWDWAGHAYTAPDGTYALADCYGYGADEYRFTVQVAGYTSQTQELTWDGGDTLTVDFALEPSLPFAAGTVTDAVTGEPIADAEIYAYRYFEDEEWGGWWDWAGYAYTAPDGTYTLYDDYGYGAGDYYISVWAWGYVSENREVTWDGAAPLTMDFALERPAPIATGSVTDAVTGEPIADAAIDAYRYFEDEEWGGWWDWAGYAYTAPDGTYTLADYYGYGAGEYRFTARVEDYFSQTQELTWDGGDPLTVDFALVPRSEDADILVTPPGFDDMRQILDGLGWDSHERSFDEILAPGFDLSPYRALFLNCGSTWVPDEAGIEKLTAWVDAGGALYASDYAYNVIEACYPDAIEFPDDPYIGARADSITADVLDTGLANYLDPESPPATIELTYDLGGWVVPSGVAPETNVLLAGTVPTYSGEMEAPLAMTFTAGSGRVLYTTFHNEAQLSETQSALLRYFALIPYAGQLSSQLDDWVLAEYPGALRTGEYFGIISAGQTQQFALSGPALTALSSDGPDNLLLGANWQDATLKVELLKDGAVVGSIEGEAGPDAIGPAAPGNYSVRLICTGAGLPNVPYVVSTYAVEQAPNTAPVAVDDAYEVTQDTTLTIAAPGVLSNDTDEDDGDTLSALKVTDPQSGTLTFNANGSFVYTPDEDFTGTDTFTYKANDGTADSNAATVSITVTEPDDPDPTLPAVIEVAGADRYATAVEASKLAYPSGADTVVIATGRNWPDALGGSALAGALDAPILLVRAESVPDVTKTEIERLKATRAVIVGGELAVGPAVAEALRSAGLTVERVAGPDRYRTADAVALRVIEVLGEAYDGMAFVATGGAYADAVAAGPLAASKGWPIYLAHPTGGLRAATLDAMTKVTDALVLGGPVAVSDTTYASLVSRLGAEKVARLAGESRYGTAAAVAAYGVEKAGLGWNRVGIATGQAYPDALAGGVLQGKVGSVMLLTRTASLPPETSQALTKNKAAITTVTYFGGELAVSAQVRVEVAQILK